MMATTAGPWSVADIPDLSGRQVIVTGANAGLGAQITTRLAVAGASITLACRSLGRGEAAAEAIRAVVPGADLRVGALDLADLAAVATFVDEFVASHQRLDLLVNNAGLMAIDQARTADGFEMQFGVNHLGHYALTARLLPVLLATPGSRVATMSSMGHRAGRIRFDDLMGEQRYRRWGAYFQSKLANLLFTAALQRRLTSAGSATIAVAAHPGATNTDLGTEGGSLSNRLIGLVVPFTAQSVSAGALPMLRAGTDPAVTGGQYYGPRFELVGAARLERPSSRARNSADAERLWARSAELTSLDPFA